jgi:hypothetical protein
MTPQTPSVAGLDGRPDVHVWMTPLEAAEELGCTEGQINRRLDEGDFESRVNRNGVLQVSVCLTKRPDIDETPVARAMPIIKTLAPVAPAPAPASAAIAGMIMPFAPPMSWQKVMELKRARRSSRIAWASAAAMFLIAGAAALYSYTSTLVAVPPTVAQAPDLSQKISDASAKATTLVAERDALAAKLAESKQALSKVQAELTVDRNVEDTLFKAVLASHEAKAGQAKSPVLADISN